MTMKRWTAIGVTLLFLTTTPAMAGAAGEATVGRGEPAGDGGEELSEVSNTGCYIYHDDVTPTYWQESNDRDGLQTTWTGAGGKSFEPDTFHGWHPTFWTLRCIFMGNLPVCDEGCGTAKSEA